MVCVIPWEPSSVSRTYLSLTRRLVDPQAFSFIFSNRSLHSNLCCVYFTDAATTALRELLVALRFYLTLAVTLVDSYQQNVFLS